MWGKIKTIVKGYIYEWFSIDNDQHPRFLDSYRAGMASWQTKSLMEDLIHSLESEIPTCDPYRTNALCQIRGWKRAYKERFITT